jgi:hypothetical protein
MAAFAGDVEPGFVARKLPFMASASATGGPRHVPQPFPEGDDLELRGDGPSPWVVTGGLLASGAAISGLVAVAAHARSQDDEAEPEVIESAQKRRTTAGYTALGLAGGAGLCLVFNRVW